MRYSIVSSESDELNRQEPVSNLKIILTPPITYSTIHFHSFIHPMLQSIAKAGSSSVAPLRTCARCLRNATRVRVSKPANGIHQKTFSTAMATESTISIDEPTIANPVCAVAGPSRNRMRNVRSQSTYEICLSSG